jgi:hypothetical protein
MEEEVLPEPDRMSTKPRSYVPRPKIELHQVPIRIHPDDHKILMNLLKKDDMSYQKFISYCIKGYMDADPHMLKMVKTYREQDLIPRSAQEKHVMSHRERAAILDEIERNK